MPDTTYQPKVYLEQGAEKLVVKSGGQVKVESGGQITNDGTQAAAIASLTDNSGGTADSTIADVEGTYTEATLANNFADLAAKVNSILAALRGAGIIAT